MATALASAARYLARLGVNDVVVRLASHEELGLTGEQAAQRLAQYGRNELQEKPRPTFLQLVIAQLNNFVVILLIVASLISALLGDWVEAGAIMLIVVLNAILGVVQESRAEEALAALKKMAAPEAQVLRDGRRISVPAPSWCRAMSSSWKPATSSRPTCA